MEARQMQEFETLFKSILSYEEASEKIESMDLDESAGDEIDHLTVEKFNQLDFRLKSRQTTYFKKIRLSLQKIHDGSFGTCEDCGDEISIQRLKARPIADMCIVCKEEAEREERTLMHRNRRSAQYNNVLPISGINKDWVGSEDKSALISFGTQDGQFYESQDN